MGRWKMGPQGGYWDPNDTGPDQYQPTPQERSVQGGGVPPAGPPQQTAAGQMEDMAGKGPFKPLPGNMTGEDLMPFPRNERPVSGPFEIIPPGMDSPDWTWTPGGGEGGKGVFAALMEQLRAAYGDAGIPGANPSDAQLLGGQQPTLRPRFGSAMTGAMGSVPQAGAAPMAAMPAGIGAASRGVGAGTALGAIGRGFTGLFRR